MRSDPVPALTDLEGDTLPGGYPFRPCTPKFLPDHMVVEAARRAREINPANHPPTHALAALDAALPGILQQIPTPFHLALMTGKNFPPGATITVGFLESTPADLQQRILSHMNAWYDGGVNVRFVLAASPQLRITREGGGYWSYIGTDLLSIPAGQPTMCLQAFTMGTPESEYRRVVRHETGHSLGFPHEHSRREIVELLDPARTIAYFERTQGWSEGTIREQILMPLDERSIRGTPHAEQDSIMCYSFKGECTVNRQPIVGGVDLTPDDLTFGSGVYPGLKPAPPPSPPPGPAPPPAASNRVRGYLSPAQAPRKLVVYVPGPDGGPEMGWQYDGAFVPSKNNVQALMFDGPGKRLT